MYSLYISCPLAHCPTLPTTTGCLPCVKSNSTEIRTSPHRITTSCAPLSPPHRFHRFRLLSSILPLLAQWWCGNTAFLAIVLTTTLIIVTNVEQLLSFIPNVCERQACGTCAPFAIFGLILCEQCRRRRFRFVMQRE